MANGAATGTRASRVRQYLASLRFSGRKTSAQNLIGGTKEQWQQLAQEKAS